MRPASDPATPALQRRLLSSDSASNSNLGQIEYLDAVLGLLLIGWTADEEEVNVGYVSLETVTAEDAEAVDPITG